MMFAFQHDSFTDLTPLKNWNPSSLKDLSLAFQDCKNLENLDGLENWDVSNLQTLESTFKD